MNFVKVIRNVRVLVIPKPRAFSYNVNVSGVKQPELKVNHRSDECSTVSGHKQPELKASKFQPNEGIANRKFGFGMMSKFHDFAQEHSVSYKAASTFWSKRGVVSILNTDRTQRYLIKWNGFEKENSYVYVDAKFHLVITGFNRSLLGFGKQVVPRVRRFQLPVADYSKAVIDAEFHEDMRALIVEITSFRKQGGALFEVK